MNIIEIIAQDVFDKIRGRFENVEMGDEGGAVTSNPRDARFFDFDFAVEGNTLGRVSISLGELGSLKVFYSQGITEDVDTVTLDMWFDFLKEMRYFAKRRMLRFDTRDITKGNLNKNDYQYLAQNGTKENNMNESAMYGGPKTSLRKLENTLLRVRHSKVVDENQKGSRSRNISAIFIENSEGERFKYPFIHLAGAKAMQRHVANGGRPYDEVGNSIINMSEQIAQLTAFKRHVGQHDGMNQDVNEIIERSQGKLNQLRKTVESMSGQKFYEAYCESFAPQQDDGFVMDQATMEDYKSKFTVRNFKEDLAQYFPLIHKIMQETGTVDLEMYATAEDQLEEVSEVETANDFGQFESWAHAVAEGTLEPDTLMALKDLLDAGLTLGADGVSAVEALQGIGIHNPALEKALEAAAELNPESDPIPTIVAWLQKEDPEAANELFGSQPAAEPAPAPAEEPVAEPAPEPMPAEQPIAEAPEDRTSFQVAKVLHDKGIGYDSSKERDLISAIGMVLIKELGMSPKEAKYLISYDEDFISDTMGELRNMGEETMSNAEPEQEKPNMKEIAEVVKSFYDRETGKFPKGETGVVTHCKKMFGDQGGALAERLVAHLSQQGQAREAMMSSQQQFEEIKALAGLQQEGLKDVAKKVGGVVKKVGQKALDTLGHGSDDDLIKDLQKKVGAPQHGKKSMAQPNESFDVMLRLAGLAK
jgi:hypothetical protein